MLKTRIIPYTLQFKRPAGTSRGVYHDHKIWYVIVTSATDPDKWGMGECAPLFDLSCDYGEGYEQTLAHFCKKLEEEGRLDVEALRPYPSILFGLETALRQLEQGSFRLWDTPFARGGQGIPINGLIWMGDYDYMLEQIEAKMEQGFRCIKLKIGAINFDEEIDLLRHIRKHYSADQITLRVDANGAFSPDDALDKLKRLAELDLHSIEQPIRAGQWNEMAELSAVTPLPIALDEELIGVNDRTEKRRLLEVIKPQYIILKPTLHGGFCGAEEWIQLAESLNIGWWITSALESNVGLNAIAQWCATFDNPLPQGLGTGGLYTNNLDTALSIKGDCLWYDPEKETNIDYEFLG
ncbi:MAG: o-succinylbenzoate synthase [Dysgonomonas sp.]|nr:o-succinylbenzoate synthase [Dysgonomonas sp.]